MDDIKLLFLIFGVVTYLIGIGTIIGNAIWIGFNSTHNKSNKKPILYFYLTVILLSNLVLVLYALTKKLPITNPESLLKGLPAAIASCIVLVVLHSITSNLAKLHYKQNINDMEEK
ncbi:hypothetical protein [Bacillus sp. FSL H8-0515]|uniref:hypothetical protein n=1 Tax=Bacillus sp. FSL H8-0515 TaxID=2921396 RepID=UPI0030F74B71